MRPVATAAAPRGPWNRPVFARRGSLGTSPRIECRAVGNSIGAGRTENGRATSDHLGRRLARAGEVSFIRHRPASAADGDGDPRWDLYDACIELAGRSWQAGAPRHDYEQPGGEPLSPRDARGGREDRRRRHESSLFGRPAGGLRLQLRLPGPTVRPPERLAPGGHDQQAVADQHQLCQFARNHHHRLACPGQVAQQFVQGVLGRRVNAARRFVKERMPQSRASQRATTTFCDCRRSVARPPAQGTRSALPAAARIFRLSASRRGGPASRTGRLLPERGQRGVDTDGLAAGAGRPVCGPPASIRCRPAPRPPGCGWPRGFRQP